MKQNYSINWHRSALRSSWVGFLLLFLLTSIGLSSLKAQVSSYIFTQNSGSFTSITGTVLGAATSNTGAASLYNVSFPVTLPFSFNFNKQNYTDLTASSNGYITFGTGIATGAVPISATIAYDGAISAWGRSINSISNVGSKSGNMSWAVEGTAPNRVAVIQWENFRPSYTTSVTSVSVFSFQIRLAETTNEISTVYSAGSVLVGTGAYSSTNAQIGLRGATNADFNNRTNPATISFKNSNSGTVNSNGQSFNTLVDPPGMPADGLTYTWTPSTCIQPSTATINNITTSSATVSWTAPATAPANGYDVYYSTVNTSPNITTIPTFAGVTGLSQNLPGLSASTEYFVWVRSVCSATESSNWAALSPFNTLCPAVATMFEDFDSYATGSIVPACWDRIIIGSGTQTISSSTPNSGTRNLYQYSSSALNQSIVVLPPFSNVNAGTHRLRFKARMTAAPRDIEFGYVTNATDANSFVLLETRSIINTAYTDATSEYKFNVPTSVPANARLAIKNPGGTSTVTFYYDDVYWELAPSCLAPAVGTASNITTTTATVNWGASVSTPANGYDVYYSTTNTAPIATTTPNHTNIAGLLQNLSGLTAATTYYVWVRAVCSSTDQSSWTALPSFTTPCDPVATMFENFDSYATGSIVPACWDRIVLGAGSQTISTTSPNSGTRNLYQFSGITANATIVVLPPFSNINAGTHWLRLKARVTTTPREIEFGYITDPAVASSFVVVETKVITNTLYSDPASEYTFTLPTSVPSNARVAIKNPGTLSTAFYYDDVYWEVAPSCLPIVNVTTNNLGTTTATVSWSAPATAPTNGYDVYYSTINTAPTAGTVLDGTNSVTVGSAATSANISGLNPATTYYVWVRAKCSSTDFSTYASGGNFTTACIPLTGSLNESFTNGILPNCWSNSSTDGTSGALWKFVLAPGYGATPNGRPVGSYAWVDASLPYLGVHDVTLQTPQINLTGMTNPGIQFDWFKNHLTAAGGTLPPYDNNKLTVMVRDVTTTTWETVFANDTNNAAWRTEVITLNPSYANKTIEVRFIVDKDVAGNGYFYDDLLLDEIKVNSLSLLGTSENLKEVNTVFVYPNPFTDILNISDVKNLVSVSITDVSGRLVKTIDKPSSQLNLSELRSGLYLVTLQYKDGSVKTVKAIKK